MSELGVAVPILPGQKERWREMVAQLKRRSEEHEASQHSKGVRTEKVWLEETPDGSMVILYMEGDDLEAYVAKVFASDSDFDQWFAGELRAIHGIDPSQPPPRIEQIF